MLKFTALTKRFGERCVLDNISLEFASHQTHVLLGSSGAGKSTLLRLLLGLDVADSGQIELDGRVLEARTQREWVRHIGYVPQAGGLFPHLSAFENVDLVARTLGWAREKIAARMAELSAIVAIEADELRRKPDLLSGGQRQRIAIMRAAFLNPSVMVLDEPLGALDPILRADLQEQLKTIFNRLGKTVLMVTHDLGEAEFFGHTITLLNNAHVEQTGTFEDFIRRPSSSFVVKFLGAQRTLKGSGK